MPGRDAEEPTGCFMASTAIGCVVVIALLGLALVALVVSVALKVWFV